MDKRIDRRWMLGVLALAACAGVALTWRSQAGGGAAALEMARHVQAIRPLPAAAPDCGALLQGRQPVLMLAMGQSNAGNHGQPDAASVTAPRVPVMHDGRCVLAVDPLPGATGEGASLWTALHARLGGQWQGQPIVWAVIAVDGSAIHDWVDPQSPLRRHWEAQLDALHATGWPVAAVLWQQGEADGRQATPMADYVTALRTLRRDMAARGVMAPWWLARSTYCPPGEGGLVRRAQELLFEEPSGGFLPGPDTDVLDAPFRIGCHFTSAGVTRAATLWADRLAPRPLNRPPTSPVKAASASTSRPASDTR